MDLKNTEYNNLDMQPAFGSSASFTSLNHSVRYGDNYSQVLPQGINSLTMTLNLNFEELIDTQSHDLISFFQKQFYYEPQQYNIEGYFDNKRIPAFDYQPFYPYKVNAFNCLNYTHEKSYYDVNSIKATLTSTAASILKSVEPNVHFNDNIETRYALSEVGYAGNFSAQFSNNSNKDVNLSDKNVLYKPDSYKSFPVDSSILEFSNNSTNFISLLDPLNVFEPYDNGRNSNTLYRNSIFINKPHECSYYPYPPLTNAGYLDVRMFDFRADDIISIDHAPKYKKSNLSEAYSKYNKYGFNPNLTNLNVTFSARSNLEAKRILLFLESHLGYKRFGFHIQKDYGVEISNDNNTTPHRRNMSYFYCPEWTHNFIYFNNHTITATFIESPR